MGSTVDATMGVEHRRNETALSESEPTVVFVLGGPGAGKSTQCAEIAERIGFTHLSTGKLLRRASELDSENGQMIADMQNEGLSVPTDITMRILKKAMEESGNDRFLLDGFPRDEEIRAAFEAATNVEPKLVLFFDCSEEKRERRVLSRKEGRDDDNDKSLRKRVRHFEEHTLLVVDYYSRRGKVSRIDAGKPKEEVMEDVLQTLKSHSIPLITQDDEAEPNTALANPILEAYAEATAIDEISDFGTEGKEGNEMERNPSVLQCEAKDSDELEVNMSKMKL